MEISNFGIPGVSTGILQPKLKNRFVVSFKTEDGKTFKWLSQQVISLTNIGVDKCNQFDLKFEDDVQNNALEEVIALKNSGKFETQLFVLDGNETVLQSMTFTNCSINHIKFSDYDYAGPQSLPVLDFSLPNKVGNAVELLKEQYPEAYALFLAFSGARATLRTEPAPASVQHVLNIFFSDVIISLHNKENKI